MLANSSLKLVNQHPMKTLLSSFVFLLCLCSLQSRAQNDIPLNDPHAHKPKLFSDLPAKMMTRITELEGLFNVEIGRSINTAISSKFHFIGTVISRSKPNDKYSTVVVRSLNRQGANLTFTRTVNAIGAIKYSGRIMGLKNADAFELTMENGEYYFVKRDSYEMIAE